MPPIKSISTAMTVAKIGRPIKKLTMRASNSLGCSRGSGAGGVSNPIQTLASRHLTRVGITDEANGQSLL